MPGVGLGGTGEPRESGLGAGDVEMEGHRAQLSLCALPGGVFPVSANCYLNSLLLPLLAWTGVGLREANVPPCQMGHCTSTRPSSDPFIRGRRLRFQAGASGEGSGARAVEVSVHLKLSGASRDGPFNRRLPGTGLQLGPELTLGTLQGSAS